MEESHPGSRQSPGAGLGIRGLRPGGRSQLRELPDSTQLRWLPFHSRETQNGEPPRLDRFIEEAEVDLSEGRFIVNPGSVGQPRDGDSRASYALFDMERRCVVLHRVAYDIEETQQRIRYAGLPEYLATRLAVGH
jgi:diadenosine tetraphosphatase ApaH/serine/threonine PP2A family protein phosphatase